MTTPAPPVTVGVYELVPPDDQLSGDEAAYVAAARARNTIRGYRSDWREWCAWSDHAGHPTLPATPAGISRYLTELARHGAAVGTMGRRLSSIRFAHRVRNLPDPTTDARVMTVWEGIRRTHGAPPDQAAPLMPPELFDVLDACPTTRRFKTRGRPDEPDLAGARDRALLLVGFTAALRRSELAALTVEDLAEHPNGLVIALPRSKTNQTGTETELAVLPRATRTSRCPVAAVEHWLELAAITTGPVLRRVTKGNRPGPAASQRRDGQPARPARRRPAPGSTPSPTRPTRCAPGSSPTPTCAAPPTGRSPTRPATARWPHWVSTCGSTRHGTTTPPPCSDCDARTIQREGLASRRADAFGARHQPVELPRRREPPGTRRRAAAPCGPRRTGASRRLGRSPRRDHGDGTVQLGQVRADGRPVR